MVRKYRQKRRTSRARLVRSMAKSTKGGRGRIAKRRAYKTRV